MRSRKLRILAYLEFVKLSGAWFSLSLCALGCLLSIAATVINGLVLVRSSQRSQLTLAALVDSGQVRPLDRRLCASCEQILTETADRPVCRHFLCRRARHDRPHDRNRVDLSGWISAAPRLRPPARRSDHRSLAFDHATRVSRSSQRACLTVQSRTCLLRIRPRPDRQ